MTSDEASFRSTIYNDRSSRSLTPPTLPLLSLPPSAVDCPFAFQHSLYHLDHTSRDVTRIARPRNIYFRHIGVSDRSFETMVCVARGRRQTATPPSAVLNKDRFTAYNSTHSQYTHYVDKNSLQLRPTKDASADFCMCSTLICLS